MAEQPFRPCDRDAHREGCDHRVPGRDESGDEVRHEHRADQRELGLERRERIDAEPHEDAGEECRGEPDRDPVHHAREGSRHTRDEDEHPGEDERADHLGKR